MGIVKPLPPQNSTGVPPYYLFAFEVGGIPTAQMVGSDPANLTWIANYRQGEGCVPNCVHVPVANNRGLTGSQLMFTLLDSNSSAGGVPNVLYNMIRTSLDSTPRHPGMTALAIAGPDTSCIPPAPTTPVASVHANVTNLATCDPWGLTIQNGTKPYTVILVAQGSPVITNVTLGVQDDVLTYIDRASPYGPLMGTHSCGSSCNESWRTSDDRSFCGGCVSTTRMTSWCYQTLGD